MFQFERMPVRRPGYLRRTTTCGAFVSFEHHIWAEGDYYLPELNVPMQVNGPLNVSTESCDSLTSPTQEIRAAFRGIGR